MTVEPMMRHCSACNILSHLIFNNYWRRNWFYIYVANCLEYCYKLNSMKPVVYRYDAGIQDNKEVRWVTLSLKFVLDSQTEPFLALNQKIHNKKFYQVWLIKKMMTTLLNDAKAKVIISVRSHWINTQCTWSRGLWLMFVWVQTNSRFSPHRKK